MAHKNRRLAFIYLFARPSRAAPVARRLVGGRKSPRGLEGGCGGLPGAPIPPPSPLGQVPLGAHPSGATSAAQVRTALAGPPDVPGGARKWVRAAAPRVRTEGQHPRPYTGLKREVGGGAAPSPSPV